MFGIKSKIFLHVLIHTSRELRPLIAQYRSYGGLKNHLIAKLTRGFYGIKKIFYLNENISFLKEVNGVGEYPRHPLFSSDLNSVHDRYEFLRQLVFNNIT